MSAVHAGTGRAQLSLSFESNTEARPPYIVRIGGLELETTVVYPQAAQCSSHTASPAVGWW